MARCCYFGLLLPKFLVVLVVHMSRTKPILRCSPYRESLYLRIIVLQGLSMHYAINIRKPDQNAMFPNLSEYDRK